MSDTNGSKIAHAVKSEFALGLQRMFVIVGIPLILGVGGFLGIRAVTTIDSMSAKVDSMGTTINVLQSTMQIRSAARDEQIRDIRVQIGDHETRIRVLERPGGPR